MIGIFFREMGRAISSIAKGKGKTSKSAPKKSDQGKDWTKKTNKTNKPKTS